MAKRQKPKKVTRKQLEKNMRAYLKASPAFIAKSAAPAPFRASVGAVSDQFMRGLEHDARYSVDPAQREYAARAILTLKGVIPGA